MTLLNSDYKTEMLLCEVCGKPQLICKCQPPITNSDNSGKEAKP